MSFTSYLQASRLMVVGGRSPVDRRRRALERVNKELSRGNYENALSLVKQLKGKHGDLPAFGSAKLLPKKLPVLDKLDMSRKSDLTDLRSLIDSVTRSIESVSAKENSVRILKENERKTSPEEDRFAVVQHESGHFLIGYLLGVLPRYYEIPNLEALRQNDSSMTGRVEFIGFEFLKEVGAANQLMKDDVNGRMNLLDTQGNISSKTLNNFSDRYEDRHPPVIYTYQRRPKAMRQSGPAKETSMLLTMPKVNGVTMAAKGSRDTDKGGNGAEGTNGETSYRLEDRQNRNRQLISFSCVILGGMVTEHLLFGYSEGFYSDVIQLNSVLQWLGFTEIEKETHIRWAASNTVSLLQSYREARVSLAEAMAKAKHIGACIEAIESAISRHQL